MSNLRQSKEGCYYYFSEFGTWNPYEIDLSPYQLTSTYDFVEEYFNCTALDDMTHPFIKKYKGE